MALSVDGMNTAAFQYYSSPDTEGVFTPKHLNWDKIEFIRYRRLREPKYGVECVITRGMRAIVAQHYRDMSALYQCPSMFRVARGSHDQS